MLCNIAWHVKAKLAPPPDPACLRNARGKHVLITGGTSGVGMATAVKLAQHGASVTVTSRSLERALATAEQVKATAGKVDQHQQVRTSFLLRAFVCTPSLADRLFFCLPLLLRCFANRCSEQLPKDRQPVLSPVSGSCCAWSHGHDVYAGHWRQSRHCFTSRH